MRTARLKQSSAARLRYGPSGQPQRRRQYERTARSCNNARRPAPQPCISKKRKSPLQSAHRTIHYLTASARRRRAQQGVCLKIIHRIAFACALLAPSVNGLTGIATAAPAATFGIEVGNALLCLNQLNSKNSYDYLLEAFGKSVGIRYSLEDNSKYSQRQSQAGSIIAYADTKAKIYCAKSKYLVPGKQ